MFGQPNQGSKWLVFGKGKEGKTEFCMHLFKYIKKFGKACYYSKEQGDSLSMQDAVNRNEISKIKKSEGSFVYGGGFDDLLNFLEKKRGLKTLFIDSVDYLKLTTDQVELLCEKYKKLTIVFIAWADGKEPKKGVAKDLFFMVDIIAHVRKFVAFSTGRFSGNGHYVIYEQEAKKHHAFLNI
jgi:hypothetical protein